VCVLASAMDDSVVRSLNLLTPTHAQLNLIKNHLKNSYMFRSTTIYVHGTNTITTTFVYLIFESLFLTNLSLYSVYSELLNVSINAAF